MEQKLDDLRSERLRVMDEVCELLSDIPPSRITSLFGLSAAHIQKKLAVRCSSTSTSYHMLAISQSCTPITPGLELIHTKLQKEET